MYEIIFYLWIRTNLEFICLPKWYCRAYFSNWNFIILGKGTENLKIKMQSQT